MPTYDYSCKSCEYVFEAKHGFNEDAPPCPECGKNKLEQIINEAPLVFIKGEPSTIGQLADRNTKKMGRYELENKRREDNMDDHKKHKEVREKRHRINKMTPKQKRKWIREGD
jgi:putative FmdB family regulatory protein